MTTVVFLGPSLSASEAQALAPVKVLPPVRQGDVYELAHTGEVQRICIIDGGFNQTPAVWHKELLFALERGIDVLGAASMGALRAAEMIPFGMRGVGRIFIAYRDGVFPGFPSLRFEDDDEVAVVHGPEEVGFRAASEAMVNLRATLARAVQDGVLDAAQCDRLAGLAKSRFYPERSLAHLIEDARGAGFDAHRLEALEAWWPQGYLDLKAQDARLALRAMAEPPVAPATGPPAVRRSSAFEALGHAVSQRPVPRPERAMVEELRLDPPALQRVLSAVLAEILGAGDPEVDSPEAAIAIRAAASVPGDTDADPRILARRARVRRRLQDFVAAVPAELLEARLAARLRADGDAAPLESRAGRKQERLRGQFVPAPEELDGLAQLQLQEWYFGTLLGVWVPDDVEAHARAMGFDDLDDFHRALLREHAFRTAEEGGDVA